MRKHLNIGEAGMLTNALKEIEAEARTLRTEIATSPVVDISDDSLAWNIVGILAGNTANVSNLLWGEADGPVE